MRITHDAEADAAYVYLVETIGPGDVAVTRVAAIPGPAAVPVQHRSLCLIAVPGVRSRLRLNRYGVDGRLCGRELARPGAQVCRDQVWLPGEGRRERAVHRTCSRQPLLAWLPHGKGYPGGVLETRR